MRWARLAIAEKAQQTKSALRGDTYVIDSLCRAGAYACGTRVRKRFQQPASYS